MRKHTILIGLYLLIGYLAQAQPDATFVVDQMPYFGGCSSLPNATQEKRECSNERIVTFISSHLQYPEAAIEKGIEGTVFVSFSIDEGGYLRHPNVLKSPDSILSVEAVRVLQRMPQWEAATMGGLPTAVELSIPVLFSLSDIDPERQFKISWDGLQKDKVSRDELSKALPYAVLVRDIYGDEKYIDELSVAYVKGSRANEERSRDGLNAAQKKIIGKAKPGGQLYLQASIQHKGNFYVVKRVLDIIE